MKKIILAILLFNTLGLFAQLSVSPQLPTVIPPSAHAQSFLKYGDFPVSNYTGVPDISIPIYTIALKDISFPISISYNASGIGVDEEAGRVGLGWVLNAGGMITHTIMGRYNDFHDRVYFNSFAGNELNDLSGIYPNPTSKFTIGTYKTDLPFYFPNMSKYDLWCGLSGDSPACGGVELAPDVFNYSFLGYSGKFIFSHSGHIIKETEDNLIIELTGQDAHNYTLLTSWKITAPDGTKYYFTQPELCTLPNSNRKHNSTMYLTSIETVNGTVINLSYSKRHTGPGIYTKLQSIVQDSYTRKSVISYAMYDVVVLDKISYPGGEVRLEYKFDRIDCKQEPRLETVYINEAGSDQFKWSFIYDYFTANVSHYEKPTLSELLTVMGSTNYHANWNTKRLRLDEIKKTDMNNNQPQSHRFTYHNTGLPTKLSMAKDHWGYYNGKNNFSLMPLYTQNISQTPNTTEIQHGGDLGVDREAVELHNQAFILKEITYPAGGKTTFNYETNKYKTNDFENDPHKRDFMYLLRNTELITERGDKYAGTDWNKSEHFNLPAITEPNAGNSYPVTIRFEIKIDLEVSRFNRFLSLSIIDDTNKSHWNYIYPSVQHQIPQGSYGTYDTIMHMYTNLPPGNYSIKASGIPHFNNLNNCIDLLHVTVRTIIFPDAYLQENPFSLGGGLRIKEIKSFDTNGAQLSGKRYTYTDNGSDSELQTSGRLMFYPRYRNNYNSHSSNGLRGGGYSVGYSKVHVADIDKNGNRLGKAVFEYINIPDQNLFYTWQDQSVALAYRIRAKDENPSGIGGYKHSENGHILKETIYKNNVASPVRETEYEYLNFGSGPHIVWGILKSDFIDYYNSDCWQTCSACVDFIQQFPASDKAFGYLYPAIRPMQVSLHQKTETVYENNQPTTTITKYAYNSKHYVSKETLSSPTSVLTTVEYLYPNDLSGSTMSTLTKANRINKPVEIKQTTNNAVSRTVHNYALFNNIPQISNVMTNTGTNRELETRIVYHQYDSYGNPQHISKDGTEQVVYLWGYKGQYPIAEIRGVTYSDVIANISETTLKAIAARDQPTSTDFTNINNLRTQLPAAEVTTYTYKRLVGVQSVIDPRNVSTNYNYDAFGRLQGITRAGKQEQRYEYRYRNN